MSPLLRFFFPVLLLGVFLPFGTMALVQPIAGDLTRIGFLPERSFGWNAAQPPVFGTPQGTTAEKAKILIVGDSFSNTGRWQSTAFDKQDAYISFGFGDICADIGAFMRKTKLAPDTVIVEVIERLFAQRFLTGCEASNLTPPMVNATEPTPLSRDKGVLYGSFGAKYALGGLLYLARPGPQHRASHSGGVNVRAVPEGCARFSHADCGNALFLGDDELLPSLPLTGFDSPMVAYLKAAGVKRIIVMPIPNKTSVYLRSSEQAKRSDAYLVEFARRNGVETLPLNALFVDLKDKYRDFYFGNDTHLSNEGLSILGLQVRNLLRDGTAKAAP
jgi:hypothetical protein